MLLSKTLENCLKFHQFCLFHDIPGSKIAEAIQLTNDALRSKKFDFKRTCRSRASEIMRELGFTDISFYQDNGWMRFKDKDNKETVLPKF